MGVLRITLALCVLLEHAGVPAIIPAYAAVQCFYIISGFYMALILDGKYANLRSFYTARAIRLLPTYWIIAILALISWPILWPGRMTDFLNLGLGPTAFLGAVNFLLAGQDIVLFLQVAQGHLGFTSNFANSDPQLWNFLLVPQAWSLGVEIWFYLTIPFLVRRSTLVLAGILIGSTVLRITFYHWVTGADPWLYRFFPFELALFLGGALSYRIYRSLRADDDIARRIGRYVLAAAPFAAIATFKGMDDVIIGGIPVVAWGLYGVVAICLPSLFTITKNWGWDRAIGDFSYPIYLAHFLVFMWVKYLFPNHPPPHGFSTFMTIAATAALSALLLITVERPLNAWRDARLRNSSTQRLARASAAE